MILVPKQARPARLIHYDNPLSVQEHFQVPVPDRSQLTFGKSISWLVLEIRITNVTQLPLHVFDYSNL